jgi:hypothetical protein
MNLNDQISINSQECIVNVRSRVAWAHTFESELKRRDSGRELHTLRSISQILSQIINLEIYHPKCSTTFEYNLCIK